MNIFYQPNLPQATYLDLEESKHCIKVLRKSTGDFIQVIDGKGNLYEAEIEEANHKKCTFSVQKIKKQAKNRIHRHIAIAPTKNIDRIEWFVEKAVEIGIDEISFISCQNSERNVLKLERIHKKAISAMKQSYKFYLPLIHELTSFKNLMDKKDFKGLKTIAYVDFDNPIQLKELIEEHDTILTLIGPEGDFSKEEVETAINKGFIKVALGNSRLRTETAGIVACHLMSLGT